MAPFSGHLALTTHFAFDSLKHLFVHHDIVALKDFKWSVSKKTTKHDIKTNVVVALTLEQIFILISLRCSQRTFTTCPSILNSSQVPASGIYWYCWDFGLFPAVFKEARLEHFSIFTLWRVFHLLVFIFFLVSGCLSFISPQRKCMNSQLVWDQLMAGSVLLLIKKLDI